MDCNSDQLCAAKPNGSKRILTSLINLTNGRITTVLQDLTENTTPSISNTGQAASRRQN